MNSAGRRILIAILVSWAMAVPIGWLAESSAPSGDASLALLGNGYIDDESGPTGRS
jgi:hypothetical protein